MLQQFIGGTPTAIGEVRRRFFSHILVLDKKTELSVPFRCFSVFIGLYPDQQSACGDFPDQSGGVFVDWRSVRQESEFTALHTRYRIGF